MLIVITGATGCLGRAVLPELLAAGHRIVAVVRPGSSLADETDCETVAMDLGRPLEIERLPARCDAIVHLAQSREHRRFPDAALDIFRINTSAAVELARYAAVADAGQFVFASTGTVYEPGAAPIPETGPVAPPSFYAASKLAAEHLLAPFGEAMAVATMRLFYLYGPGLRAMLISELAQRLRDGAPIDLQGAEGMLLSPTYSGDVARVVRRALEEKWSGVYNVASSDIVSLKTLTKAIAEVLELEAVFRQSADTASPPVLPDLRKLRMQAGQFKFTPLLEGLRQTFR